MPRAVKLATSLAMSTLPTSMLGKSTLICRGSSLVHSLGSEVKKAGVKGV